MFHTGGFDPTHGMTQPSPTGVPRGPNETDGVEKIATTQELREEVDVVFVLKNVTDAGWANRLVVFSHCPF